MLTTFAYVLIAAGGLLIARAWLDYEILLRLETQWEQMQ